MNIAAIRDYLGSPCDLPEAVGYLRYVQQGSLKILNEFDRICRRFGLSYFLHAGSLLGAMRSGRYIPWDDDVDVCMPRKDYLRIIRVFNEHCVIPGLKAYLHSDTNGIWNLIKISHTDIPSAYIDIFPVDFCYRQMSFEEKQQFSTGAKQLILQHIKEHPSWPSKESFHQSFMQLMAEHVADLQPKPGVRPTVFFGFEFMHPFDFWCFDYDLIFPLRQIKYEGRMYSAPHDADLFLTYLYGDYMRLPSVLHMHTDVSKIPLKEIIALKKFIAPGKHKK